MPNPDFQPDQAFDPLWVRALVDVRDGEDLSLLLSVIRDNTCESCGENTNTEHSTHKAVVQKICNKIWAHLFGNSHPWPTYPDDIVVPSPDSITFDAGILLLVKRFVFVHPTKALQLFEHDDDSYDCASVHEILASGDPSKASAMNGDNTAEYDVLMDLLVMIIDDAPDTGFTQTVIDGAEDSRSYLLWIGGFVLLSCFAVFIQARH
ncbi:hypothetical protein F4680DRAFT_448193 [Xylaria scruposa]|nr:hypothetical protein F4680DRAFT_448193 [Xylaria scruposa]